MDKIASPCCGSCKYQTFNGWGIMICINEKMKDSRGFYILVGDISCNNYTPRNLIDNPYKLVLDDLKMRLNVTLGVQSSDNKFYAKHLLNIIHLFEKERGIE